MAWECWFCKGLAIILPTGMLMEIACFRKRTAVTDLVIIVACTADFKFTDETFVLKQKALVPWSSYSTFDLEGWQDCFPCDLVKESAKGCGGVSTDVFRPVDVSVSFYSLLLFFPFFLHFYDLNNMTWGWSEEVTPIWKISVFLF